MALTYANFTQFPLQITGISSDYNDRITAIESFVRADMIYSEGVTDAILSYFVFWFFCQDSESEVSATSGETRKIAEFTAPEVVKQIAAWNKGVDLLRSLLDITDELIRESSYRSETLAISAILEENDININENYLSKRSLL